VVQKVTPEGGQRGIADFLFSLRSEGGEGWLETGMRVCVSNVAKDVVPGPKGAKGVRIWSE
jgi:hypothetical protein